MISLEMAQRLKEAGVVWEPAQGDKFALLDRELDDRVFVINDMATVIELLQGIARSHLSRHARVGAGLYPSDRNGLAAGRGPAAPAPPRHSRAAGRADVRPVLCGRRVHLPVRVEGRGAGVQGHRRLRCIRGVLLLHLSCCSIAGRPVQGRWAAFLSRSAHSSRRVDVPKRSQLRIETAQHVLIQVTHVHVLEKATARRRPRPERCLDRRQATPAIDRVQRFGLWVGHSRPPARAAQPHPPRDRLRSFAAPSRGSTKGISVATASTRVMGRARMSPHAGPPAVRRRGERRPRRLPEQADRAIELVECRRIIGAEDDLRRQRQKAPRHVLDQRHAVELEPRLVPAHPGAASAGKDQKRSVVPWFTGLPTKGPHTACGLWHDRHDRATDRGADQALGPSR